MKCVLSLDLSTKPGLAYFEDEKLIHCNTLFLDGQVKDFGSYPYNYYNYSDYIAGKIFDSVLMHYESKNGLQVVIEETTSSKNNYSQKILEFIHCKLLERLNKLQIPVYYVRTGVWRSFVGAHQNNEEKKRNSQIARLKKKTGKRVVSIDGKRARKLDRKDYALRAFRDKFGYELPRHMEDAGEAALVGLAYLLGAPVCDGTIKGGTLNGVV